VALSNAASPQRARNPRRQPATDARTARTLAPRFRRQAA
jgi:hypothetical protein